MVTVLTACAPDGASAPAGTLPADDIGSTPGRGEPTADLAPSQISAETVPAPDTPGPCRLAELELWTAQVVVGETSADAIVRVRNVGDVWCEPDISGSRSIDPAVEPDVWLRPGEWADLVAGQSGEGCATPRAVDAVRVAVDGDEAVVPTAMVAECGWWLTAFYPVDPATAPCEPAELETAPVTGAVVVRNASFRSCRLGELVAVAAEGAAIVPRADDGLRILDLAAGDVVAFARASGQAGDCTGGSGILTFADAGAVEVAGIGCEARYELGPGRPWFGDPDLGPLTGDESLDVALARLDPFAGDGER